MRPTKKFIRDRISPIRYSCCLWGEVRSSLLRWPNRWFVPRDRFLLHQSSTFLYQDAKKSDGYWHDQRGIYMFLKDLSEHQEVGGTETLTKSMMVFLEVIQIAFGSRRGWRVLSANLIDLFLGFWLWFDKSSLVLDRIKLEEFWLWWWFDKWYGSVYGNPRIPCRQQKSTTDLKFLVQTPIQIAP